MPLLLPKDFFALDHQRKAVYAVLFGSGVIFQCVPSFTGQRGGHFLDRVFKGIQQRFQLCVCAFFVLNIEMVLEIRTVC